MLLEEAERLDDPSPLPNGPLPPCALHLPCHIPWFTICSIPGSVSLILTARRYKGA